MTALAVDEIAGLDFDHHPTCETQPRCAGHQEPVTHRVIKLICGCRPLLVCTPCATLAAAELDTEWPPSVECRRCFVAAHGIRRARDVYRVELL